MITKQQATLNIAKLLIYTYLITLWIILIAIGLLAAYYFPNWTPLEALR